jgi:hypothetical protein
MLQSGQWEQWFHGGPNDYFSKEKIYYIKTVMGAQQVYDRILKHKESEDKLTQLRTGPEPADAPALHRIFP